MGWIGRRAFVFVVIGSALAAALAFFPSAIKVDDAFITFRYAENLATGRGYVYNPGEAHLGVTCPLYGLLLGAFVTATGASTLTLAFWVHVVSVIGLTLVIHSLLRASPFRAIVALFPWAFLMFSAVRLTAGMESILFAFGGFSCVCLFDRAGHHRLGRIALGAAAGLLCLVRPDGAFLAAILFVASWIVDRRFPRGAVVAGAIILGGWALFGWLTYGGPIPDTIGAKFAQANTGLWPVGFFEALWTDVFPAWALYAAAGAALGAAVALFRRDRVGIVITLWLLVHNGVYIATGVPPYKWYYVPLVAQSLFLTGYAVANLPVLSAFRVPRERQAAVAGFVVTVVVVTLGALHRDEMTATWTRARRDALAPIHRPYYAIGQWLARHAVPDAKVAAMEVGMIGYYSERYVVDFLGLVTPGISRRVADYAHIDTAMAAHRPDYIVAPMGTTGHHVNLTQYVVRGYDVVLVRPPKVLLRRKPWTETGLAGRVGELFGADAATASFGDFPRTLDFYVFMRALATERSRLVVRRWPTGDEAWAIRLDHDGRLEKAKTRPLAAHYETAQLKALDPQPDATVPVASPDARWRIDAPYGYVSRSLDLAGPVRRVRIRLRVDPLDRARSGGEGRLWWSVTAPTDGQPGERTNGWVAFAIPRTGEDVTVAVDFLDGGPTATQRLTMLRFDLFDGPGEITLKDVWLDRE